MHVQQHQIGPLHGCKGQSLLATGGHHQATLRPQRHDLFEQGHIDLVVFRVQHGVARLRPIERARNGRHLFFVPIGIRQLGHGHPHHKTRPHTQLTADLNVTAHQLDQSADDDKPNAGSFNARGFGPQTVERLEQVSTLFLTQTPPCVADLEGNLPGIGPDRHHDPTTTAVVLDGVGQQVDQNLAQTQPVRKHVRAARHLGRHQHDTRVRGCSPHHGHGFVQHLGNRYSLNGQGQTA